MKRHPLDKAGKDFRFATAVDFKGIALSYIGLSEDQGEHVLGALPPPFSSSKSYVTHSWTTEGEIPNGGTCHS